MIIKSRSVPPFPLQLKADDLSMILMIDEATGQVQATGMKETFIQRQMETQYDERVSGSTIHGPHVIGKK